MKLTYRQKLYLSMLMIFLVFFNGGIFSVAALQNARSFSARQENFLTQNNLVLQQMISDMETVYTTRPQSIPLIIKQQANRQTSNGIYIQVTTKTDEYIYSSFPQEMAFKGEKLDKIRYRTETVNGSKIFCVYTILPQPFDNYYSVTGYDVQALFDSWNTTVKGLILLSVLFSSVIAVVLHFFINKLTQPLMNISRAAQKFGEGDFSVRIQQYSQDEIGTTAQNFNEMAEKITNQLTSLQQMAQDKQRLIDDISHEMRTPLTAIRGYTAYMQSAKLDTNEYYESLSVIDHQAQRMEKLSEGILSFTNLRGDSLDRTSPVNLADLLKDVHNSYFFKANKENVALKTRCENDLIIYGERTLYESLIGNIIDNRINACIDRQTKNVTVKGYAQNGRIFVEINDTGIGMSRRTIENVHKPFFRADKSRSRKRGGAGLGGALCKEIADIYNIGINYRSQQGKGTKVTLTFTT